VSFSDDLFLMPYANIQAAYLNAEAAKDVIVSKGLMNNERELVTR
jgi:hypothetical protein